MIVTGYEGVEEKPLRDCTDADVRAMAAWHSQRVSKRPELEKLFGGDWFLQTFLEQREQERNPLEGVGFFPLLGFAWWRLESEAAIRSSAARWLFRLRGRIKDGFRRGDGDDWIGEEGDDDQIAVGGSAFGYPPRGSAE
jgi:hypothetical protein